MIKIDSINIALHVLVDGGAQCSWSVWSSWTECPLLPIYGTQYRVSVYRGPAQECKHNESIQSRKCEGKVK